MRDLNSVGRISDNVERPASQKQSFIWDHRGPWLAVLALEFILDIREPRGPTLGPNFEIAEKPLQGKTGWTGPVLVSLEGRPLLSITYLPALLNYEALLACFESHGGMLVRDSGR